MKIPDKYEEESWIEGFNKGWGECLGKVIGFIRSSDSWGDMWGLDLLKESVLSKHPYHSLRKTAKVEE